MYSTDQITTMFLNNDPKCPHLYWALQDAQNAVLGDLPGGDFDYDRDAMFAAVAVEIELNGEPVWWLLPKSHPAWEIEQYRLVLTHPDGSTSTPSEILAEADAWLREALADDPGIEEVWEWTQDTLRAYPKAGDLLRVPESPEPGVSLDEWVIRLADYATTLLYTYEGIRGYAAREYPDSLWNRKYNRTLYSLDDIRTMVANGDPDLPYLYGNREQAYQAVQDTLTDWLLDFDVDEMFEAVSDSGYVGQHWVWWLAEDGAPEWDAEPYHRIFTLLDGQEVGPTDLRYDAIDWLELKETEGWMYAEDLIEIGPKFFAENPEALEDVPGWGDEIFDWFESYFDTYEGIKAWTARVHPEGTWNR